MYSYDQVLADVKDVYEQLTGLPAPEIDIKKPRYPLPKGVNPVSLVQSEIDQLNMYLINSGISGQLSRAPMWTPPAEIYETQEAYVINLELPGMSQDDVNVSQANNILTVRGTRRFKKASEESRYHTSERSYGTFERLFPLPSNAQTEKIRNKFTSGILQITIPKIKSESSGRSGD
jgi:HSP20 family protein